MSDVQAARERLRELTGDVRDCLDGNLPHDSMTYRGTLLHELVTNVNIILHDLATQPADDRRFPIQDGPSVPWSYMAPHERQAQTNHGQSLERLAQRGGLGAGEAELVVMGVTLRTSGLDWDVLKERWIERAERVNNAWLAAKNPLTPEQVERLKHALQREYAFSDKRRAADIEIIYKLEQPILKSSASWSR